MTAAHVIERTRAYITENFLYMRRDFRLDDNDSLLGSGIIDSMGVMEVIAFIETEFGVDVDDEEVTEENLGSIRAISRYVVARTEAAAKVA
jgi:acyl carrier protein